MFTLGAVALFASTTYHWRSVAIVGGGFVSGVVCHPRAKDVVYLRTDIGGAYRLDPKTNRWIPLQDWITRKDWNLYGVESIGLDPSDAKRVYLAVGTYTNEWGNNGAILRSDNLGPTWTRTDLPFKNGGNEDGRSIGERLAVDPHDGRIVYFGTRNDGLWRSEDRGAHWAQVSSFPIQGRTNRIGIGWVFFDGRTRQAGPTQTIIAAPAITGQPIYRSLDAGKTWLPVPGCPKLIPHHGALAPDGTLYVTYSNAPGPNGASNGSVWKLSTSGEWNDITPLKPTAEKGFGYAGLSLDPMHPGTLIVSTLDRWGLDTLFRSRDGGATWTELRNKAVRDSSKSPFLNWDRPSADFGHWIGCCQIDPFRSDRAWYVTGATCWTTNDLTADDRGAATHWTVGAEGIEETAVIKLASPPDGANVFSCLGDIGGFAHFDLKQSPPGMQTNPLLSNTDDLDFAELAPNIVVRVGRSYGGAHHGGISDDGGKTWTEIANDPPGGGQGGSAAISCDGKTVIWSLGGARPYVTSDRGAHWTAAQDLPSRLELVSDRVDASTFYAFSRADAEIYVSHDKGLHFSAIAEKAALHKCGSLVAVPGRQGHLWVAHEHGLARSIDGGLHFAAVPSELDSAEQVSVGRAAPGADYPTLYVIGKIADVDGVYRSVDEGRTWVRINDAKTGFGTMQVICGDPKLFGRVYIGTNGRGVVVGDPFPTGRR